jgi:vacuolar-type H+-ATPase subunit F/Vma7
MSTPARIVYIGDRVTASGLALVGVQPHVTEPRAEAVEQALYGLRGDADLIILDQACARVVATQLQQIVLDQLQPPIVVLPSIDGAESADNRIAESARRLLGLAGADT